MTPPAAALEHTTQAPDVRPVPTHTPAILIRRNGHPPLHWQQVATALRDRIHACTYTKLLVSKLCDYTTVTIHSIPRSYYPGAMTHSRTLHQSQWRKGAKHPDKWAPPLYNPSVLAPSACYALRTPHPTSPAWTTAKCRPGYFHIIQPTQQKIAYESPHLRQPVIVSWL